MLKSLFVKNFTAFETARFDFSPGINVIVGENGVGKSHVLKLGYAASFSVSKHMLTKKDGFVRVATSYNKQNLQKLIANKLCNTFRPDSLGRLARRGQGRTRTEIEVKLGHPKTNHLKFSFSTANTTEVILETFPEKIVGVPSIFFPTKEVISLFPGFASLYRDYNIEMDETYFDLCLALERPLLLGKRYETASQLLNPLENILEGKVFNENGRFVLKQPGIGNMEIPLVAEGLRKLASVAYLIANGSLDSKSTLYWDEPETNLNPTLIAKLAAILVTISKQGIQIILATHNLFLLKEIDLQLKIAKFNNARFFALAKGRNGVQVSAGDSLEEIEPIVALDMEIDQADRYNDWLYRTAEKNG